MNRKALGLAFLAGVLMCGLGGGVAFGQYSKLEYAGERILGEENLVTDTAEATIETDGKLYVDAYAAWKRINLETDESIPMNKIVFDVTYNPERVSMAVEKSKKPKEPDRYVKVVNEYGEIIDYVEEYNGEYNDEGEIFHVGRYNNYDEVKDFFKAKDIFLSDLKKGKIGSYNVVYIENITVRVNPANADRVELYY